MEDLQNRVEKLEALNKFLLDKLTEAHVTLAALIDWLMIRDDMEEDELIELMTQNREPVISRLFEMRVAQG